LPRRESYLQEAISLIRGKTDPDQHLRERRAP
jgi:hypothetical protein